MTERRTATERHYLLADGTYRAAVHLQPIHYQAADGSWQPIDTTLHASAETGFAVANETNALRSYLPAAAGWVRVEAGNASISFRPAFVSAADDFDKIATVTMYEVSPPDEGTVVKTLGPVSGLVRSNMAVYGAPSYGPARLYVLAGGVGEAPTDPPMTVYCFAQ
jgi:hypothetical protein